MHLPQADFPLCGKLPINYIRAFLKQSGAALGQRRFPVVWYPYFFRRFQMFILVAKKSFPRTFLQRNRLLLYRNISLDL